MGQKINMLQILISFQFIKLRGRRNAAAPLSFHTFTNFSRYIAVLVRSWLRRDYWCTSLHWFLQSREEINFHVFIECHLRNCIGIYQQSQILEQEPHSYMGMNRSLMLKIEMPVIHFLSSCTFQCTSCH